MMNDDDETNYLIRGKKLTDEITEFVSDAWNKVTIPLSTLFRDSDNNLVNKYPLFAVSALCKKQYLKLAQFFNSQRAHTSNVLATKFNPLRQLWWQDDKAKWNKNALSFTEQFVVTQHFSRSNCSNNEPKLWETDIPNSALLLLEYKTLKCGCTARSNEYEAEHNSHKCSFQMYIHLCTIIGTILKCLKLHYIHH